jgi:hypothetical protein
MMRVRLAAWMSLANKGAGRLCAAGEIAYGGDRVDNAMHKQRENLLCQRIHC